MYTVKTHPYLVNIKNIILALTNITNQDSVSTGFLSTAAYVAV